MDGAIKSSGWKTLKELEKAWGDVASQKALAFNQAKAKLVAITDADEKKTAEPAANRLRKRITRNRAVRLLRRSFNAT